MKNLLSILPLFMLLFLNVTASAQEKKDYHIVVDQPPSFPGCTEIYNENHMSDCASKKMLEFIYANLTYPAEAREQGVEGQVVIQFIVEKNGSISNVTPVRKVAGGCTEAALKIVESMNDMEESWIPGKLEGEIVRVKYTLPVKFKLDKKGKKKNKGSNLSTQEKPSIDKDKIVLKKVDQMPVFPGCDGIKDPTELRKCGDTKMLKYVYSSLKYPALARKTGVEGTAIVSFHVNKDGTVSDFRLLKDPGAGCGDEAVKVLKSLQNHPEKWTPAIHNGEPVNIEYVMPVKFKLQ